MIIKELIEQLNKYDENLEVIIAIDDKQEDRLEIGKHYDKLFITKDTKIRIDELQNEIKRMKFESLIDSLSFINKMQSSVNYDYDLTWNETMQRLGLRMNGYKED